MLAVVSPEPSATGYEILGRRVRLPVEVRDASTGVAAFVVPLRAARRIVPEPFEPVELLPDRTLLAIAAIDYRDNDLGDYHEVSLTFFVRAPGRPRGVPWLGAWLDLARNRLGTWIWRLPVDQTFTCEAGRAIWGFPKTVDTIRFDYERDRLCCRLEMDGEHVLTLSLPRGGTRRLPEASMATLTRIEGVPHRTRFTQGGEGVGFALRGARLQLGTHALADELRALGLPRRALFSVWTERMHARFEAPEKL
jgi:hypothetical protein